MTDLAVHDGPIFPFTMADLAVHDGPIFAFTMVRNSHSSTVRWIKASLPDRKRRLAVTCAMNYLCAELGCSRVMTRDDAWPKCRTDLWIRQSSVRISYRWSPISQTPAPSTA